MKTRFSEKFNRPVTAFLTFENEEGLNRCKAYNDVVESDPEYAHMKTLLGVELNFEDASEPTDIIWENRHFTGWDRFIRTCYIGIKVTILLSLSFVLIFYCSQEANKPLMKYPPIDCEDMEETQGDSFQVNAYGEYDRNFDAKGKEIDEPIYMGVLKCYCDRNVQFTPGFSKSSYVEGLSRFTGTKVEAQICKKYFSDTFNAKIIGYSMSVVIVTINFMLRLVVIRWVKWIGHDTHSSQIKAICNGVFLA